MSQDPRRLINDHVRPYYTTTYDRKGIINLRTFVTYVFGIILLKILINRPIKVGVWSVSKFPTLLLTARRLYRELVPEWNVIVFMCNREFEKGISTFRLLLTGLQRNNMDGIYSKLKLNRLLLDQSHKFLNFI